MPYKSQCHRISGRAQYVTLQNYFSHPSLVIYFFSAPPVKLKQGQQLNGRLLIANHLDQLLLWWANEKHWAAVRSYLLHSFLQVHRVAAPFTLARVAKCAIKGWQNQLPEPNRHILTFLYSIFLCRIDHILSTAGDALRHIHTCHIPTKNQFWTQYKDKACMKVSERTQCQDQLSIFYKKIQQQHQAGMSFKKASIPTPGWYVPK
jgi:hypothetical protein